MADIVELILELRNVAQFVSGSRQASTAAGEIGTKTEEAGKKAGAGWKGLAKWAGGAAAIYGATRYVKGAVSATEDLAKSTIAVSRTTGMDTQTSSEWAALMKERGVSTAGGKKAPAEIAKLSRAIATAQGAGDKARQTLALLGVSQRDVAKGNTAGVLYQVADALQKMQDPAQRAALMQQLFGRSGQALLPILMKGREGVQKLLDEQKAAGNYISGKGIKSAKDLIAQQRALNTALAGVKVQLGQQLLPVILSAVKLLVSLLKVIQPITKNATLFKIVLVGLAAAFIAYKVAMVAATIAQVAFDTALSATGITLIVAAVFGLIAAIAFLVKYWGTLKAAFIDVWAWIRANWPLLLAILLGPFAVAAVEIYKHFDAIKGAALGAFDAIKGALPAVAQAFSTAFGAVKDAVRGAINTLIRGWNSLQFKVPGFKVGPVHFGGITLGVPQIPLLAQGGMVTEAGMAVVGERGPELVSLPVGATVSPAEAHHRPLEIHVPVMLDGREIARSVARVASNQLARA